MTESMYYVLLSLRRPIHGDEILSEILTLSRGRLKMGPGTLVALLTRLEKQKFIMAQADTGGVGKTYRITLEGLTALKKEYALLTAMVEDGREYAANWPL